MLDFNNIFGNEFWFKKSKKSFFLHIQLNHFCRKRSVPKSKRGSGFWKTGNQNYTLGTRCCLTLFKSSSLFTQHLEQEKHELRRRFENREGEWEGRVSELESDVKQLQDELERQQVHLREADREKSRAVQELSEQNQRLLDQLSKVSHKLYH